MIFKYASFNIWKREEQKNSTGNFKIRGYVSLLIFEKAMSKKITPAILRFVSMLYLIFEKGMNKKIAPRVLRIVSMLFQYFKKGWGNKLCQKFSDL